MFRSLRISLFSAALALAGCASADSAEVGESTSELKSLDPIVVVAVAKVKPSAREDFREAALILTAETRREAGNLGYQLQESAADPTTFLFYERWQSAAASERHMKGAALSRFFTRVKDEFEPGYPTIDSYKPLEPSVIREVDGRAKEASRALPVRD